MRIIIDMPEEVKDDFIKNFAWKSQKCVDARIIENGIMIPDNPTNGDMIKAIFPNAKIDCHEKSELVCKYVTVFPKDCDTCQDYSWDWWNAPYKQKEDFEWAGEGD